MRLPNYPLLLFKTIINITVTIIKITVISGEAIREWGLPPPLVSQAIIVYIL